MDSMYQQFSKAPVPLCGIMKLMTSTELPSGSDYLCVTTFVVFVDGLYLASGIMQQRLDNRTTSVNDVVAH